MWAMQEREGQRGVNNGLDRGRVDIVDDDRQMLIQDDVNLKRDWIQSQLSKDSLKRD